MKKSKSLNCRRVKLRDLETGKIVWGIWTESVVTIQANSGPTSAPGLTDAKLEDGDHLNPTDDPRIFKALFSEKDYEIVEN